MSCVDGVRREFELESGLDNEIRMPVRALTSTPSTCSRCFNDHIACD
jgi:hypothetical protein